MNARRSLSIATRLAWREARRYPLFTVLFIINLTMGLFGFALLSVVHHHAYQTMAGHSRQLLGADLVVSSTQRRLSEEELSKLVQLARPSQDTTQWISTLTMLQTKDASILVQLLAVGDRFPLVGELRPRADALRGRRMIFSSDLQQRLAGQAQVRLANADFQVLGPIEVDSTSVQVGFNFVPKVYIHWDDYSHLGLDDVSSRFQHSLGMLTSDPSLLERIKKEWQKDDIKVTGHEEASENFARSVTTIHHYLGLMALIAMLLCSGGAAFVLRTHLITRLRTVAVLRCLGIEAPTVSWIYALLVGGMSVVAIGLALAASQLVLILAPQMNELPRWLNGPSVLQTCLVGWLCAMAASLPLLASIRKIEALELFRPLALKWQGIVWWLPALVLFTGLSFLLSKSTMITLYFVSGTVMATSAMMALALVLLAFVPVPRKGIIKVAILRLKRQRLLASTMIVATSVGTLLICLIPMIYQLAIDELKLSDDTPSVFLVDIQEDQKEGIEVFIKSNGARLLQIEPMIRARLQAINAVQLDRLDAAGFSKEQREEQWARQRGQNLSYRDRLSSAEQLVDGEFFPGSHNGEGPVPISLEERFARRLNVGLRDKLEFDVQGVMIEGVVSSIRRVRWTSFQPNFFVLFPLGVLEDAPKIFLATAKVENTETFTQELVRAFPNVSVISIATTVEKITTLIAQLQKLITWIAILTLFAGFLVFVSMTLQQDRLRRRDFHLLKILGAQASRLSVMVLAESAILATVASFLGCGLSFIFVFFVRRQFFSTATSIEWQIPLMAAILIAGITVMVAWTLMLRTIVMKTEMS